MVTKLKKSAATNKNTSSKATSSKKAGNNKKSGVTLSSSVKDSAQQIWQAGLGAFTKAQVEGSKAFEALVKEGVSFQRKTQSAAEEKINEATQKMSSMATDISSKASGQWDKLENIFEDRVAKALNKLGVPSAKDVSALIARIDALNASVQKLSPKKAAATPAAKPAAKVAPKPAAKSTAAKAVSKPVAKTVLKPATETAPKPVAKKAAPRKAKPAVAPAATPVAVDQVNPE